LDLNSKQAVGKYRGLFFVSNASLAAGYHTAGGGFGAGNHNFIPAHKLA
jgi:hypothetical protein